MITENSKTNEFNKFIYQFTDQLNLKTPNNENIGLVNLSICYTWKGIESAQSNNKFQIAAPSWNDEFDLPGGSYSIADIQDYFEFIIKKHEILAENSPIKIFSNKIKSRIANNNIRSVILEIKNGRCKIDFTSIIFNFQYDASYIIIRNQTISPT